MSANQPVASNKLIAFIVIIAAIFTVALFSVHILAFDFAVVLLLFELVFFFTAERLVS